ncbi:unnamed protein product [Leptosia nina]|uniref:Uncharacterized protein n=1 Tax=Leptosia nina TaxID=320188 RepID=A0AAV1JSA1_9NEOP
MFSFVIDYANCFKGALRTEIAIMKKYESVCTKTRCSCREAHMRAASVRDRRSYVLTRGEVIVTFWKPAIQRRATLAHRPGRVPSSIRAPGRVRKDARRRAGARDPAKK